MIIICKSNTSANEVNILKEKLESERISIVINNVDNNYVLITPKGSLYDFSSLYAYDFVQNIIDNKVPFIKASREYQSENTIIDVNGVKIGGEKLVFIAGSCSVESEEQIDGLMKALKNSKTNIFRAGAYKPRTSPYSFDGLKDKGLSILKEKKEKYQFPIVSEILDKNQLPLFIESVDIIQVGARNMQNFDLLDALGKIDKPILLKRGFGSTIEEWLLAAEHILSQGNKKVILCERGIKTFENSTRYTLDISSIPVVKKLSHLPIIVDPSHAAGNFEYVESLAKAAIAAGADGLMIEVHEDPVNALSDGKQSLRIDKYLELIKKIERIAIAIDRKI